MASRIELTPKWLKRVYPWRGYDGPVARPPQPLSAADFAAAVAERLNLVLLDPDSDPELVDRTAPARWDVPDPVAFAVLRSVPVRAWNAPLGMHWPDPAPERLLAWIAAEHGPLVAVATLFHSMSVGIAKDGNAVARGVFGWPQASRPDIGYVRALLATVDDETYAAAVRLLTDVDTSDNAIAIAAFLAPTDAGLVERALRPDVMRPHLLPLVIGSAASADHIARIVDSPCGAHLTGFHDLGVASYATAAARVGADAVPLFAALLAQALGVDDIAVALDLLSMSPSPDAARALLERRQTRGATAALRENLRRSPATALPVLGADGGADARWELEAFCRSHPAVVKTVEPQFTNLLTARTRAFAGTVDVFPEADPLPPLSTAKKKSGDEWVVLPMLPQLVLADGTHALRRARVPDVIDAFRAGDDVATTLQKHCDRASLARWAWAVFEQWERMDCPVKGTWVLELQGRVGDDETAVLLTPKIRVWPGESANKRALVGVDALGDIGTEAALQQLYAISQKVSFKALRKRAEEKVGFIAAQRNLTPEQLADRLLPDFGLSSDATAVLDFGPRQFAVGFDAGLQPFVTDDAGKARKALPKAAAGDNPELAAAAAKQFTALKKQVRTFAGDQSERLQWALRFQRHLRAKEFVDFYLGHPLMKKIVSQFIWGRFSENGALETAFTVAADGSFQGLDDQPVDIEGAWVGLVHPVQFGAPQRQAWAEVVQRRGLTPPFPQIDRPVQGFTADEAALSRTDRFRWLVVPTGALLGMAKRGWQRSAPLDAGIQSHIQIRLPTGEVVAIDLDPGIVVGDVTWAGEQTLGFLTITPGVFRHLDPVMAAEILGDLAELEKHR